MLLKFNVTAAAVDSRLRLGKRTFFCNPQSCNRNFGKKQRRATRRKEARQGFRDLFWLQCRCNTTLRGRQTKAASHKYVIPQKEYENQQVELLGANGRVVTKKTETQQATKNDGDQAKE